MLEKISDLDTIKYPVSTGCVRYNDLAYLVISDAGLSSEKIPNSTILTIDRGNLGGVDLPWFVASLAVCHVPEERLIALGQQGFVYVLGGGVAGSEGRVEDIEKGAPPSGYFREVRGIARGRAYAVGTGRQCYRREGPRVWTCMDAPADPVAQVNSSFESIDGFTEEEIYAVGWEGEIWFWNGIAWRQQASPTNVSLHKVVCAPDGYAYACGKMGTIVKGRQDSWAAVEHDETDETFWGAAWFGDRLFLSTTRFLYELKDNVLSPVQPEQIVPTSCYHLSAADGVMWSIGFTEVFKLSSGIWEPVIA